MHRRRERPQAARKLNLLEAAKTVLRRTGRAVFSARIDEPRFQGFVVVDTRKMSPEAVIEMARLQLEREWLRNCELRREHGLGPPPRTTLEDMAHD